ncbi:hypothetical protein [Methylomonas rapida]|uniref:Uncharacterized protein n=1 Tax=Methylomonas rapida TaxID=2963939 RepID=A0ABY7GIP1_9GAMM|nr:hypothetical protein [Methylomonas rapida]WAR44942.1 hypothetical protein NM686_000085 [Methylomonas rapida]
MKEIIILYGAAITVSVGFLTAWLNSRAQVNTAKITAEKDKQLQLNEIYFRSVEKEVETKLSELEKMYETLLCIELENSKTMSYMQSSNSLDIEEFRSRYISNCKKLHEIQAKIAIRFPRMIEETNKIYSQANVFWGNQENLLRTDIKNNPERYQSLCDKIHEVSYVISDLTSSLKSKIVEEAEFIQQRLVTELTSV